MEQYFTKLKNINPDKEFSQRSLALILNTPQKEEVPAGIIYQFSRILNLKTGLMVSAAFIVLIVSGLTLLNQKLLKPSLLANFDPDNLNNEMEQLDIQIQFPQAEYYERSAKEIEIALNKTSDEFEKE